MKIFNWDEVIAGSNAASPLVSTDTVLTVGSFDGLHRGHRALLDTVLNYKNKTFLRGVVTFVRPTRLKKNPRLYQGDILTLSLKLSLLQKMGFDFAVLIDFSDSFAEMSAQVFFQVLVKGLRLKSLCVGADFCCGYKNSANVAVIKDIAARLHFDCTVIDRISDGNNQISSSEIRDAVFRGNFKKANTLLGYNFFLDISQLQFKSEKETAASIYLQADIAGLIQVMPKSGKYNFLLHTAEENTMPVSHAVPVSAIFKSASLVLVIKKNMTIHGRFQYLESMGR